MMVYENYTQTNIKWLEQIPSHWKLEKMKYLFYVSKKENEDETPNVLSLTQKGIIERDISTNEGQLAQSYVGYNIIEKDDIVFNPMDLLSGYVSKSKFDGVISQAYTTIKPLKDMNVSYYEKFFQNWYHYGTLWHLGKGVSYDNRWTLNNDTLLNIKLPVPPIEEQNKIVDFINEKSVQIEKFIQDKTRFIQLLKEQKEAVINEAVTKGLDNTIQLKDSEIEWLGNIAEHWEIRKLKYCVSRKLKYGANETAELDNEDYPRYIRITDFNFDGTLKSDTFKSLLPEIAEDYLLDDGDILFARSGATVGKTFQFKNYDGLACFAGYLIKVSPNEKNISSDFLFYYTKSYHYAQWKDIILNKATIENIGADKYNDLYIPIPPKNEQLQIVEYIENELNQIDKLIDKTTKEIELIKEYKTSLINEAVSGKIKV
jgi:type I restriction enzyme S subunit